MTNKMRNLRDGYSSALIELGHQNEEVVVVDADLALSTKTKRFGTVFPNRFFDFGVAEANMMGAAAGFATCGKIVFASTFAVFATGRCYDQIRQSIAYPNLNVKIVATHAGISVGGDGASHQMLEDIALMRVLPNMLVVTPTDATEIEDIIPQVAKHQGPCYVRMGRADSPVIFEKHGDLTLGKAKILEDGSDVTLIGTGTMVSETLMARELLKKHKIDARVILIHTIKPIDQGTLKKAAHETGCIITAEEHSIIGGLGSAVSEALNMCPVPMKRIGVPDVFGESGEAEDLVKKYGLTAENISKAAQDIVRLK